MQSKILVTFTNHLSIWATRMSFEQNKPNCLHNIGQGVVHFCRRMPVMLKCFPRKPFSFFFALHPTTKLLPYLLGIFITDKLMREWDRVSKFASAAILWANRGKDIICLSFQVLLWEETRPSVQLWCWQGPVGSLGRSFPLPPLLLHLDGGTLLKEVTWAQSTLSKVIPPVGSPSHGEWGCGATSPCGLKGRRELGKGYLEITMAQKVLKLQILWVWEHVQDTVTLFSSQLPDSPLPLHSQVVFTAAFQKPEHLVNHQTNVCLSGFLVENIEMLHLTSHSFCFQTLFRPVSPLLPHMLWPVMSTKEVLPRRSSTQV